MRTSPFQPSKSPARYTASPPRSSKPSSPKHRVNLFTPTQSTFHSAPCPNFKFYEFTNPRGVNTRSSEYGFHVPEQINYVSTQPHYTLKLMASSCSFGQLENGYVEEGRNKDLPLDCLHFAINPRFTVRFWHSSKYFFALADRQKD